MLRSLLLTAALGLPLAPPAWAQATPAPGPPAPADRPVLVAAEAAENPAAAVAALDRLIAPAVRQARATLPKARRRFLAGLPAGQAFFVTTRLQDPDGTFEQVFVQVTQWSGSQVQGTVASELGVVKTYRQNQSVTFPAAAVLDWTISRPDGSEEGNYVGKLLDAAQK